MCCFCVFRFSRWFLLFSEQKCCPSSIFYTQILHDFLLFHSAFLLELSFVTSKHKFVYSWTQNCNVSVQNFLKADFWNENIFIVNLKNKFFSTQILKNFKLMPEHWGKIKKNLLEKRKNKYFFSQFRKFWCSVCCSLFLIFLLQLSI